MNKNKKQPNEGNQPSKNRTEQLQIAGKPTEVEYKENGEVNVANPDGLEGEDLKSWQKKAQDEISALARANKKGYDANRKLEEVEQEKKEAENTWKKIQKEKKELQEMKNSLKNREMENSTPDIRKELGVNTYEEVRDILDSNPEKYFEAFNKFNSKSANYNSKLAENKAQESILRNQIAAEGYDPDEVKAFCDGYLSAPFTRNGYEVYKKMNSSKKTETDNIADIQDQKISFVNKGTERGETPHLSADELDKMSVSQLKEYYSKLNKR